MGDIDLQRLLEKSRCPAWRISLARTVESKAVQTFIICAILLNAVILGLETNATVMGRFGLLLATIDRVLLFLFVAELLVKIIAYRLVFFRSGWNWFDAVVIGVALVPGTGPWAVLRSLRVLRVLRLLTVIPQLRRVIAAFIHAIPGLSGVLAVMGIFFYTGAVLATNLFGSGHPEWFGSIGRSLFTLFQIMTLESWSMGIVRPVLETQPWAWAFFVPFIIIATFTILNLFIGIIVSTMQELGTGNDNVDAAKPAAAHEDETSAIIARLEADLAKLRKRLT